MKIFTKNLFVSLILCITFHFGQAQSNTIIKSKIIGKGEPMILIHGMSCSDEVWEDVVNKYQDSYEIHLISLAGFGNKEAVEVPQLMEAVKDELIAYTRSKQLKNTILMGHSMGGFLSLWAAADAPSLFSRIISVDGLPYFPAMQGLTVETAQTMVENMQNNMENMDAKAYEAFQRQIVASMISAEEKREKVVAMGLASNQQMTGQAFKEMYITDLREKVAEIRVPVLVLSSWYGYRNYGVTKGMTQKGVEAQVANITNARVEVADKALHFIFYDEPEWFFTQVDGFLQEKI
jgi:pimeloyl-ACP methyl ester carboxylesterase